MPYNFRLFQSSSKIGQAIAIIKHCFFQKQVLNEMDFERLKLAFKSTFKNGSEEKMFKTYFACLQSLIYLASHMKMPQDIEERNISILLNELAHEKAAHGVEIWIDKQEGINVFHALARSQAVEHSEFFYEACGLFNEHLAPMLLHKDTHGFTPLNTACKEGNMNTVKTILSEAKCALSHTDFQTLLHQENNEGYTPFISAYHSLPLLNILSEKINEPNLRQTTKKENTVLMLACLYGKRDALHFLLEKAEQQGTETLLYLLHHQNSRKENVLDIALRKQNYGILDSLLEYAAKHMEHEKFIEYSASIYKGADPKAMTSLLYQAKQYLQDFKRFIFQPRPDASFNIFELWRNIPEIRQRIMKYLPTNQDLAKTASTPHETECNAVQDIANAASMVSKP